MISYLNIKGFGVFHEVSLELPRGLSVFTGETGAGKSMVIDAVLAALGHRTPKDIIRQGQERASVEILADKPPELTNLSVEHALYSVLEGSPEIVLSREILKDRSYLRVNGKMVTMSMAQEIGEHLVDIHGQQEHHSLLRPSAYTGLLDGLCRDEIEPARRRFGELFQERQSLLNQLLSFVKDEKERKKEIDLLSFQVDEIEKASLSKGEEESLRAEYSVLSSMRKIMEMCEEAYCLLYQGKDRYASAFDSLGQAQSIMKRVSALDPYCKSVVEALDQTVYSLEAALDAFRVYQRGLSFDPQKLEVISDRLDLIQRLRSKYGPTIEDILDFGARARESLDRLLRADDIRAQIEDRLAKIESEMVTVGTRMSTIRTRVAQEMGADVTATLGDLGMPGGRLEILIDKEQDPNGLTLGAERVRIREDGFDRINFMFTANSGLPVMPLGRVASGGELSRLMLAIKAFTAKVDPVPTLIFDEIDAGIGGRAGQKVAEKLHYLSQHRQVICVTHLPSIAAMADNHFIVEKMENNGTTLATVRLLKREERVREIARMLSGSEMSVSLQHAEKLLDSADSYKENTN